MIIGSCKVVLKTEWCFSLKDKRSVVKSLIEKIKHKFNVSVAEVDLNDVHQTIVIGFACVTNETAHANSIISNVLDFIEDNTDAVIEDYVIEIL